jgi:23S rRNA (uridine2552-2'-O)-methyltransferase
MNDRSRPDHWALKARAEGYAARSVYKLEEIDRRYKVAPRRGRALDLGCAPGSWSQWLHRQSRGQVQLVGIDIQEVKDYPGRFLQRSIAELPAEELLELLGGAPDFVMSDMAHHTSGNRLYDHVTQLELATLAVDCALACLRPGGHLVVKIFDGEDANALVKRVGAAFDEVKRCRPQAVRSDSKEFYAVGLRRRSAAP